MKAVAVKKSSREKVEGLQEMGTLRCDGCGEEKHEARVARMDEIKEELLKLGRGLK